MQVKSTLSNEDGSILFLALIFLVLLTVLGFSATSTSTIEVQIAGNHARFKQNLYLAEAMTMDVAQTLWDSTPTSLQLDSPSWVNWLFDASYDFEDPDVMLANGIVSTRDPDLRYAAVINGIAAGSSLDMSAPSQMYSFDIYGMYSGNGHAHVALGFLKRM
jgi:hypothetical protein